MISLIAFSAAIGWCGTPYPMPWHRRKFPPPPPPPPDDPEWRTWFTLVASVFGGPEPQPWRTALGVAGGIVGGLTANSFLGNDQFIVIGMAAYAGGRIASDIGSMFPNK